MGKGDESAPIRISDRYVIPLQEKAHTPPNRSVCQKIINRNFILPQNSEKRASKNGVFCMRGVSVK